MITDYKILKKAKKTIKGNAVTYIALTETWKDDFSSTEWSNTKSSPGITLYTKHPPRRTKRRKKKTFLHCAISQHLKKKSACGC